MAPGTAVRINEKMHRKCREKVLAHTVGAQYMQRPDEGTQCPSASLRQPGRPAPPCASAPPSVSGVNLTPVLVRGEAGGQARNVRGWPTNRLHLGIKILRQPSPILSLALTHTAPHKSQNKSAGGRQGRQEPRKPSASLSLSLY